MIYFLGAFVPLCLCAFVPLCLCAFVPLCLCESFFFISLRVRRMLREREFFKILNFQPIHILKILSQRGRIRKDADGAETALARQALLPFKPQSHQRKRLALL